MKIKAVYRICRYCEEEILDGDEMYEGVNGAYCADCLRRMDAEEFLRMEGEHYEVASALYPDIYDEAV